MSKRLQVVVDDAELGRFQDAATQRGLTLSEWVRQVLREAESSAAVGDPRRKLEAIRAAARLEFPTADIETMLDDIERGYAHDTP
jgi:hypothetical protein